MLGGGLVWEGWRGVGGVEDCSGRGEVCGGRGKVCGEWSVVRGVEGCGGSGGGVCWGVDWCGRGRGL